jgi:hypothetical protein
VAPTARWCSGASEFSVLPLLNPTRLTPDGTGFTLEVGADSFWRWALRLLWLSLVVGLIAWILGHRAADSTVGYGLRISLGLSITIGSAWGLRRELWPPRGEPTLQLRWQLRWQEREQCWFLLLPSTTTSATAIPGRLSVQLDLQRWMLLRFQPTPTNSDGPTPWLALSQRDLHAHWHTLRCAVHASPLV